MDSFGELTISLSSGSSSAQAALVPADRHQLRAVPPVGVGVAGLHAALATLQGELLGLGQPAVPDRQHDLHRLRHELDRGVVLLGQQGAQLAQAPLAVRVGVEEQVGDEPDQAHREVAAAPGPGRLADQLVRDGPAPVPVLGAEQAVVGEAQRLHTYQWIAEPVAPRPARRRMPACSPEPVVGLGGRRGPAAAGPGRWPGRPATARGCSRASIIAAAVAVRCACTHGPYSPSTASAITTSSPVRSPSR